jgi:hypothetical protein
MANILEQIERQEKNNFETFNLKDLFTKQVTNQNEIKNVYAERTVTVDDYQETIEITLDTDLHIFEIYQTRVIQEVPYCILYTIDIDDLLKRVDDEGTVNITLPDYIQVTLVEALNSIGIRFKSTAYGNQSRSFDSTNYNYQITEKEHSKFMDKRIIRLKRWRKANTPLANDKEELTAQDALESMMKGM